MAKMTKREVIHMQIKRIEKEIRDTPYHKGTERHIGLLRARLAKLKDSLDNAGEKSGGGAGGYSVKKQGDATIVLVGPPSAGKSTLLNAMTNAESKVAPYAFTTLTVIPGMMNYHNANIQILDVPGLIEGAEEGKGRGREVLSVVRGADLLVIMSDVDRPQALPRIANALENNGIRINKTRPKVKVEKKLTGGLLVKTNLQQDFDKQTIKDIASEFGVKNAEITINQKLKLEELMDIFSKNRVYIPALFVLNKADLSAIDKDKALREEKPIRLSAKDNNGLDRLRSEIWKNLDLMRVYLVRRDQAPNYDNPVIVKQNISLKELAETIGEEFAEGKTKAKIWGEGAKFPGQEVSLKTKIQEAMQIRFL